MRLPFAVVAVSVGLLVGCSGEKTHPKGEVKIEGVTTRKKPVRPWTTAQAKKTEKPTPKTPAPVASSIPEQVIKQLNEDRARLGLLPLRLHPTLAKVAQEYADLLAKEKNANFVPGGKNLNQRTQEAGYAFSSIGSQAGNITGTATPQTVLAFVKQPQLAAGLATAVDIGIGIAADGNGQSYITIIHGTPPKM